MSNILSTVRATLIALVVASPALAQTPRDIENLLWQQTATVTAAAPVNPVFAGAGSAASLVQTHSTAVSHAPRNDAFASSFGAADLARLSGVSAPARPGDVLLADRVD